MAGVELNTVSTANTTVQVSSNAPVRETIRRTSDVNTAEIAKEKTQKEAADTRQREEDLLENVVARSEHGDTVQVSDDGATELEESREGTVIAEDTSAENTKATANESEENFIIEQPKIELPEIEKPKIQLPDEQEHEVDGPPFSGYSSSQLEAFYQQGEISAYAYDAEMSRREELREELLDENRSFGDRMAEISGVAERTIQANFAVESAINSESKIDLKDRLDAVNSIDESRKAAARISEEEGRLWDYQLRA